MMWQRSRLFADSGLLRRRGAALALALLIEALLALLLFFLAPPLPVKKEESRTTVFGIEASRGEESADKKPAKEQKKAARARTEQPRTQPPPPVPQPVETPVPVGPPTFLKLTRNEYQQGDIAKVPSRGPMRSSDSEVADSGGARDDDSPVVGKAPNGDPLYAPGGWVRKPTHAELGPYRRPNAPRKGVGRIACRTAPGNRVEDCQIVGESPIGSGFGYSLLQAAWQFRMRPPRLGGKDLIGVWVIVTCDYDTFDIVK